MGQIVYSLAGCVIEILLSRSREWCFNGFGHSVGTIFQYVSVPRLI